MSHFALTIDPPPPLARLLARQAEGAGADLRLVNRRTQELKAAYESSTAMTYRDAALSEVFSTLAREWKEAARLESSHMRAADHPAFRAIVGLGDEIVPILLRELERRSGPWFLALREITGEEPVGPEARGNPKAVADAWVRWGRTRGLI